MPVPVKICGIKSLEDAKTALKHGASAIGFIFFKHSKRFIDPDDAFNLIKDLGIQFKKVGVFVDENIDVVNSISDKLGLDFIQLHGNENEAYCKLVKKPVIKVFRVGKQFNESILSSYEVAAFLFDNYKKNELGGTGEAFDWALISDINTSVPIILSGGLNLSNVVNAIDDVNPSAIDLNSGVELLPGLKDEKKIIKIFNAIASTKKTENFFERQF